MVGDRGFEPLTSTVCMDNGGNESAEIKDFPCRTLVFKTFRISLDFDVFR